MRLRWRGGVERLQLKDTFPNPAGGRATIRYAVPEGTDATEVTMRLYDVLGPRVQSIVGEAEAERHEQQLSVAGLSNGTNFLTSDPEPEPKFKSSR